MNKEKLLKYSKEMINTCFKNLKNSEKQSDISYWYGILNCLLKLEQKTKNGEFDDEKKNIVKDVIIHLVIHDIPKNMMTIYVRIVLLKKVNEMKN